MRIFLIIILYLPLSTYGNTQEVKEMFRSYMNDYDKGDSKKVMQHLTPEVIEAWGGKEVVEKNIKSGKKDKLKLKDDDIIVRQGHMDKDLFFVKTKHHTSQEYVIKKENNIYKIKGTNGDIE
jgi:hypothetical protein